MDKSNLPIVSKGLMLLFISGIVTIFSGIPFLGAIAAIASGIISVYGLFTLSGCHPAFKTALTAAVVGVVLNIVSNFLSLLGITAVAGSIASFFSTYLICTTIDEINTAFGVPQTPNGALVWKLQLVSVAVGIPGTFITALMLVSPLFLVIVALVTLVAVIAVVVAAIFYMILLYKSSKALEAAA